MVYCVLCLLWYWYESRSLKIHHLATRHRPVVGVVNSTQFSGTVPTLALWADTVDDLCQLYFISLKPYLSSNLSLKNVIAKLFRCMLCICALSECQFCLLHASVYYFRKLLSASQFLSLVAFHSFCSFPLTLIHTLNVTWWRLQLQSKRVVTPTLNPLTSSLLNCNSIFRSNIP